MNTDTVDTTRIPDQSLKDVFKAKYKELSKGPPEEIPSRLSLLVTSYLKLAIENTPLSKQTIEGYKLVALGLGLPEQANSKPCTTCEHVGYTTHRGPHFGQCSNCDGEGIVPRAFECRNCDGTGKFTLRDNRKSDCRTCDGTGKFIHPRLTNKCSTCYGRQLSYYDTQGEYYRVCRDCEGVGELEVLNPVLSKVVQTELTHLNDKGIDTI